MWSDRTIRWIFLICMCGAAFALGALGREIWEAM